MKFVFPRESYFPKGSVKVSDKRTTAVAYLYTTPRGAYGLAAFHGKAQKPSLHYTYTKEAHRNAKVAEFFAQCYRVEEWRNKRAAERKAWVCDYKVGEIVNTHWGYDQTNVEHYEIIAVKGTKITLKQIGVTSYATGWAQERVQPLPGEFVGEPFTARATQNGIKCKYGQRATRTRFTETVPGVKVYSSSHTSSYA